MDIKEQSLQRALNHTLLTELPPPLIKEKDNFWIEAIVLVRKRDYSQSYALATRKPDGKITYTADFGNMSPISGLIYIYPYTYLDQEKYLIKGDITQKRDALARFIGNDQQAKQAVAEMTDQEVENTITGIAVDAQKQSRENKRIREKISKSVKKQKQPTK